MEYITEIVKSFGESGLVVKDVVRHNVVIRAGQEF